VKKPMPKPGLFNPSGMALSVATHLMVLTIGLGYASVRPFEPAPAEAMTVDIVSPDEVEKAAAEAVNSMPLETPEAPAPSQSAAASGAAPMPAAQQQPLQQPIAAAASAASAGGYGSDRPPPAAQTTSPAAASWRPPEPDLAIKYQVNLGLPARAGDDFDAAAFAAAKVAADDIAKFRERLKACSALPDSVAPTDKVTIKLRASFLPDGTLATTPLLIEASASAKGPLLMRAAIDALNACQPHAVLPADKYNEWKVLDLSFTPKDFRRG
jgi:hypothetical protein